MLPEILKLHNVHNEYILSWTVPELYYVWKSHPSGKMLSNLQVRSTLVVSSAATYDLCPKSVTSMSHRHSKANCLQLNLFFSPNSVLLCSLPP